MLGCAFVSLGLAGNPPAADTQAVDGKKIRELEATFSAAARKCIPAAIVIDRRSVSKVNDLGP